MQKTTSGRPRILPPCDVDLADHHQSHRWGQASLGRPSAHCDAVGDAPRQPVSPLEDLASRRGERFIGDPRVSGVSNDHGGVCDYQDPRLQRQVWWEMV